MNKDQIFADALKKCKKEITRNYISQIIADDKTNTIRKYLNSFGITQLALYLQDIDNQLRPTKEKLVININDARDPKQRKVQLPKRPGLANPLKPRAGRVKVNPSLGNFSYDISDSFNSAIVNNGQSWIDSPFVNKKAVKAKKTDDQT